MNIEEYINKFNQLLRLVNLKGIMLQEIIIRKLLSGANSQYAMYTFTSDPRIRAEAENILRNMKLGFGMTAMETTNQKNKPISAKIKQIKSEEDLVTRVVQIVLKSIEISSAS